MQTKLIAVTQPVNLKNVEEPSKYNFCIVTLDEGVILRNLDNKTHLAGFDTGYNEGYQKNLHNAN